MREFASCETLFFQREREREREGEESRTVKKITKAWHK